MIRVRKEDRYLLPIVLVFVTTLGGALGVASSPVLMWFLNGKLWQYFATGAGIGFLLAGALCLWMIRVRPEEEGDIWINLRFWKRKRKLPLRDELTLAHDDELSQIDRETCRG